VTQPVRIPVEDLRRAADILLDHLESTVGGVVELDRDMFWAVPPDALYDVYQEPGELTIGQLTESRDNIARVLEDQDSALSYGLVWLADVLRAVGHEVVR
jgi:hypothetical protein